MNKKPNKTPLNRHENVKQIHLQKMGTRCMNLKLNNENESFQDFDVKLTISINIALTIQLLVTIFRENGVLTTLQLSFNFLFGILTHPNHKHYG